jgi:glutathione synthase/RimK-type ligase-like ATP-grasp enzyme
MLQSLEQTLAHWPKPVINAPQHIASAGRDVASELLQQVPGLLIPPTLQVSRAQLQAIAAGAALLPELFEGCDFPVILRPVGSHAGRDLDQIKDPQAVSAYLARVHESDFFLSRFIDYSGQDGLFRKYRIALIQGKAFACHMAVSSHWMVHYVNAGMYEDAQKRAEEALFMLQFDDFLLRHGEALQAISQRTQLDYLCIDCAQTPQGELLVFEIDHAMVVHAMDSEQLFPHKQTHMIKVKLAFRDLLLRLHTESAARA